MTEKNTEDEVLEEVVEDAPEPKKAPKKVTYRALVGLSFRNKRVEAGELVTDLPRASVGWLLKDGCIEKVEED